MAAKKTAARSEFDGLMKQATDLLAKAMDLQNADAIGLNINGTRVVADLYWAEREREGLLQSDGTFKLGRKP